MKKFLSRHREAAQLLWRSTLATMCSVIFISSTLASPVNELTRLLGNYTTYSADFSQVTLDDQKHYSQEGQGRVYINRPDSFCWETLKPGDELVIAHGSTLWHYDAALAQATEQQMSAEQMAQNPAMILMRRVADVTKLYNVSKVQLRGKPWFLLKPKKAGEGVQKIYLYFAHGQMTRLIVVNNLGDRSLFDFSHIQLNRSLSSSLFTFKPPKGVDLNVQ